MGKYFEFQSVICTLKIAWIVLANSFVWSFLICCCMDICNDLFFKWEQNWRCWTYIFVLGMVYLGGFTILPYSSCLLCIGFHSHNKHKNMEDDYSQFLQVISFFIGDKSLSPAKPCCLFIVSQYVSWRIQTLEFYFDRYLEATIFFFGMEISKWKMTCRKKAKLFYKVFSPVPLVFSAF